MFSPLTLGKSFRYAARGIASVARTEHSFRVQLAVFAAAVLLGLWLRIRAQEMVVVVLVGTFVLVLELLNSAVEHMVDLFKPRLSHQVEVVKNVMAGAVLVAAAGAAVVGLIIFVPYLRVILGGG